jgi:hypothetical protein
VPLPPINAYQYQQHPSAQANTEPNNYSPYGHGVASVVIIHHLPSHASAANLTVRSSARPRTLTVTTCRASCPCPYHRDIQPTLFTYTPITSTVTTANPWSAPPHNCRSHPPLAAEPFLPQSVSPHYADTTSQPLPIPTEGTRSLVPLIGPPPIVKPAGHQPTPSTAAPAQHIPSPTPIPSLATMLYLHLINRFIVNQTPLITAQSTTNDRSSRYWTADK